MMKHDPAIYHARTLVGFSEIHHPNCAAVIYKRTPSPAMQKFLDWLPVGEEPDISMLTSGATFTQDLTIRLSRYNPEPMPGRAYVYDRDNPVWQPFFNELHRLVRLYERLTSTKQTYVSVMRDNWSNYYHLDSQELSFISTYRGPGTDYLSPVAAYLDKDIPAFAHPSNIVPKDESHIHRLGLFDLMAFKGYCYNPDYTASLYHASPIDDENETQGRFIVILEGADRTTLAKKAKCYQQLRMQ